MKNQLKNGTWYAGVDCLEAMKELADQSVDMVLCDLPYGTTNCSWDAVIPFEPLWEQYRRICKGAIVLSATQPFSSLLVCSNLKEFKYAWTWEKTKSTGFLAVKYQPLRCTEDILVFGKSTYCYPQKEMGYKSYKTIRNKNGGGDNTTGKIYNGFTGDGYVIESVDGSRYPRNLLTFSHDQATWHPTQKPVALWEYLIKTYTDAGMTVLDNTAGSGTTAIAAENTGRKWICMEMSEEYSAKAMDRIKNWTQEDEPFGKLFDF